MLFLDLDPKIWKPLHSYSYSSMYIELQIRYLFITEKFLPSYYKYVYLTLLNIPKWKLLDDLGWNVRIVSRRRR